MAAGLVTVLINNYNYGRYLRQAIDSALAQSYSDLEVVVVDDGSTDDSRDVIASYAEKIRSVLKPNGGQATAINAGFAMSRGDVICLLDSDDWFLPGKVTTVAEVFAAHAEASWVFHPLQITFADGRVQCNSTGNTHVVDERREARRGKLRGTAPPTSGLCFSRKLLDNLLPMPAEIRITSDNYLKLSAMSLAPGIYLDEGLAAQRIHESNAYTLRADRLPTQARIHLLIAQALKDRFPELARLSDKVFAKALADYIAAGESDAYFRTLILDYIRRSKFSGIADIVARTGYHYLKRHIVPHIKLAKSDLRS
jgi:glycosyltransferase involved in cell wall biosynthesis